MDAFLDGLRGSELGTLFAIGAGAALTFMRLFPNLTTTVAPKGIVSLQLAWRSARAETVIGSWRQRHLDASVKRSLYVDFLYIAGYTAAITFLALLAGRATKASGLFAGHTADLTADFTAIAAWIAGACDCLENGGLLLQLRGATGQPVPAVTSTISAVKWVLAPAAALFSLGLLAASAIASWL